MAILNESVNARQQYGEQRRRDRAPQREGEQADATTQTAAHALCRYAGLNDR
jgi:hypothetical protein